MWYLSPPLACIRQDDERSWSLTEEREEILQAAIDGVQRVAVAIASLTEEHRERAFEVAEHSYQQTVRDLGYSEDAACVLVSAMMFRLRAGVKELCKGWCRW